MCRTSTSHTPGQAPLEVFPSDATWSSHCATVKSVADAAARPSQPSAYRSVSTACFSGLRVVACSQPTASTKQLGFRVWASGDLTL
jgi:hypothetical protein